ncbi:MAG: hypothetical protein ACRYFW_03745 [Janthinobacterium lividum]
MRPILPAALAFLTLAAPAVAQMRQDPRPSPSPRPTKVVTRSDRLVTARTGNGGTMSYNCKKPENAKRPVCRGTAATPRVLPR